MASGVFYLMVLKVHLHHSRIGNEERDRAQQMLDQVPETDAAGPSAGTAESGAPAARFDARGDENDCRARIRVRRGLQGATTTVDLAGTTGTHIGRGASGSPTPAGPDQEPPRFWPRAKAACSRICSPGSLFFPSPHHPPLSPRRTTSGLYTPPRH